MCPLPLPLKNEPAQYHGKMEMSLARYACVHVCVRVCAHIHVKLQIQ